MTVYHALCDWPEYLIDAAVESASEDETTVTAYAENAASADLLHTLAITDPRDPAACMAVVEAMQADIRRFVETQCIEEIRDALIQQRHEAA